MCASENSVLLAGCNGRPLSAARLRRGHNANFSPDSRLKNATAPFSNSEPTMPFVVKPSPSRYEGNGAFEVIDAEGDERDVRAHGVRDSERRSQSSLRPCAAFKAFTAMAARSAVTRMPSAPMKTDSARESSSLGARSP